MKIICPSDNYDDTDGGWSTNVVLDEYFEVVQSKHVGHCETVAGRELKRGEKRDDTGRGGTWAKQGFSNFSMFIVINNLLILFIIAIIISNIFSSTYIINIMIN